jgi:glutamyl/glutaminyl-tRNA synthetase
MKRVRFAPSPTGSLHVGNALSAVANRALGNWLLLRIDDTDPQRNVAGGEEEILLDLRWLGLDWEEGPARQSERRRRHLEAAAQLGARFDGITLLREDGSATYHLASVVDDVDFAITHVIRGADHRSNERLHRRLHEALGSRPPEYQYVGLMLGADGKKLSKRHHGLATISDLRDEGIPHEAVRAYLDELGLPRGDVRLDFKRLRRLSTDALAALSDEELAAGADAPVELAPALRGVHDLNEARELARVVLEPARASLPPDARPTLERFRALREEANGALDEAAARELIGGVREGGGDLHALRLALTGRERGPELWTVVRALPREEALRRVDALL